MIFLSGHLCKGCHQYFKDGTIGLLCRPGNGYKPQDVKVWAADNACFTGKDYPGDEGFIEWLRARSSWAKSCLFASAPDVVGDAEATLHRSAPLLPRIRELGYRVALVAQDGLESRVMPWDDFDVLFVGGSTDWKLSEAAAQMCRTAKEHGKSVHVGRINSTRRWERFAWLGADSADGTILAFGCRANISRVLSWRGGFTQGVIHESLV